MPARSDIKNIVIDEDTSGRLSLSFETVTADSRALNNSIRVLNEITDRERMGAELEFDKPYRLAPQAMVTVRQHEDTFEPYIQVQVLEDAPFDAEVLKKLASTVLFITEPVLTPDALTLLQARLDLNPLVRKHEEQALKTFKKNTKDKTSTSWGIGAN